ncbi:hypothetical protein CEXT_346761 [Caerostris extrusa]|uniref:Uncharacterized protein n=1 Tax=Caerostris extrusa TaxID=172846 RepID=A0AAV4XXD7_CAEEX|nr:hypothetical protein CEXT_346761 [Caerostris extrusa]
MAEKQYNFVELLVRNSQKSWWNSLPNLSDWPRTKVVAVFRLDCLVGIYIAYIYLKIVHAGFVTFGNLWTVLTFNTVLRPLPHLCGSDIGRLGT